MKPQRRVKRDHPQFATQVARTILAEAMTAHERGEVMPQGCLFDEWSMRGDFVEKYLEPCWKQKREDFLERWIERWPGTRPLFWWLFDTDLVRNPSDPESEAAFLRRQKLLLPGELERIPQKDFIPGPP